MVHGGRAGRRTGREVDVESLQEGSLVSDRLTAATSLSSARDELVQLLHRRAQLAAQDLSGPSERGGKPRAKHPLSNAEGPRLFRAAATGRSPKLLTDAFQGQVSLAQNRNRGTKAKVSWLQGGSVAHESRKQGRAADK